LEIGDTAGLETCGTRFSLPLLRQPWNILAGSGD